MVFNTLFSNFELGESNEEKWRNYDDVPCFEAGGSCQMITNYCPTCYSPGLCGGPDMRQCCNTTGEIKYTSNYFLKISYFLNYFLKVS